MAQTGSTATERREKRVALAASNPVFFGETYIRPYDDNWDGPLPEVPRQMLAFAMSVRRGVIMTPPEFLKPLDIETLVLMGDGQRKRLGDVEVGNQVVTHRGRAREVLAVAEQGELECLRITTFGGREVIAAPDHPFLTPTGWVQAGDLIYGEVLAAVPHAQVGFGGNAEEARLAGYIVGDGSTTSGNCAVTCYDEAQGADIITCAESLGFEVMRCPNSAGDDLASYRLKAGARQWVRDLGLVARSHEKRVPASLFRCGREAIANFIGAYFACDGHIHRRSGGRQDGQIIFSSVSRDLLADVQHLLLRLGIRSRLRPHSARTTFSNGQIHQSWKLSVGSQDDLARFIERVPVPGCKAATLRELAVVRQEFEADFCADRIVSIEPAGLRPCRCLRVADDSSFTANDLAVHNTTTVSQVYPLWLTYRYAQAGKLSALHGALMSELQELAERNLSVIAWHIENNPDLRRDFVDVHGRPLVEPDPEQDKWTDEEIIVRRSTPSKDPTWQAKGVKTTIQGARLNHFIGDDMVTPGSAKSVAKQRDALNRWDTEVTTRLVANGQALIAGNFNHAKDLLSTVAARSSYKVLRRPSLHVPGNPEEAPEDPRDPDAVVALPEKWPRRRLLGELSEKPFQFPIIHLLRSATKGGTLLREAWVTRITLDDVEALHRTILFAIDPAPGADVDPDPSFFTITVGILTRRNLDIVESFAARMEPTEQVELLSAMVAARREQGHVGGIGVSKVSLDKYFQGAVEVGDPSLRPLLHPHSVNEGSKVERLGQLGTYFKGGWARVTEDAWHAKTSGPDDREQETTLAEEWVSLPMQRHDDRLDGVDVLVREALSVGGHPGAQESAFAGADGRDPDQPVESPITAGMFEKKW